MNHSKWLLTGTLVLCLAVLPLVGCVSKSDYEALEAEYATLTAELDSVSSNLTNLQADYQMLKVHSDELTTKYETAKKDYDSASRELSQIRSVFTFDKKLGMDSLAWVQIPSMRHIL